jgi:hypothetical protein
VRSVPLHEDYSGTSLHRSASSPLSDVLRIPRGAAGVTWSGVLCGSSSGQASERDLRALAAIVSEGCPGMPDGEGLLRSLLADLISQIRCVVIGFALANGYSHLHAGAGKRASGLGAVTAGWHAH